MEGSGFYAWGVDVPDRSCYRLKTVDKCGDPVTGVDFEIKGRDHGYFAETWTDIDGEACLDAIPSEPIGDDFDADELGGERFWVDIRIDPIEGAAYTIDDHENAEFPGGKGGCAVSESCVAIERVIDTYRWCEDQD
jgi:hypothetical protein